MKKHWIVETTDEGKLVRIPKKLIEYLEWYKFVNAMEVSMAVADYIKQEYPEYFEDGTDLSYWMLVDCGYAAGTYLTLMNIKENDDEEHTLDYSNKKSM